MVLCAKMSRLSVMGPPLIYAHSNILLENTDFSDGELDVAFAR